MAVVQAELVSEKAYRRLAVADPHGRLELHHGQLREKPDVTSAHGGIIDDLAAMLYAQIDRNDFRLRFNHARLRRSADSYYVPDIAVIPAAVERALRRTPRALDAYPDPLPLVIEIWSPSTGDYDIQEKQGEYQARGDFEIWYIHPYERMLTRWLRQPDGTYAESVHRAGIIYPLAMPHVAIDLDELFGE